MMAAAVNPALPVEIYVDGSYRDERIGYGAVVLQRGEPVHELYGPVRLEDAMGTRQVAGELFAVGNAVRWCQAHGIRDADIHYDYFGIEKWATGEWKAKQPITQRYAQFIRSCGVRIRWVKVKSHTGNRWNDYADELALRGVLGQKQP